jgi:hypothetical protein
VSTRQWPLMARGGVWLAGLVALIISAVIVASDNDHGGIFRAFGDFFAHWRIGTRLVRACWRNRWRVTDRTLRGSYCHCWICF